MDYIGIILYIIQNIFILIRYYRKNDGYLQFPFIMALVSIGVELPQLTTIYAQPALYPPNLIPSLLFTMITTNIAFVIGYEMAVKKPKHETYFIQIDFSSFYFFLLIYCLCGFVCLIMYDGNQYQQNQDNVIQIFLKTFSNVAFAISLSAIIRGENSISTKFILFLSIIPIIGYAFFIKGSRTETMTLFLSLVYFLGKKYEQHRYRLRFVVLCFFFIGTILSSSIALLRNVMKGNENFDLITSDLVVNEFEKSFTMSYSDWGMDLGNAAYAIEFCKENNDYDYGYGQVWNTIIQDFLPKRLIGENIKESFLIPYRYMPYTDELRSGTTVMTCYFSCFSAFSYFGSILAFFFAYFIGIIWRKADQSSFYMFLHLFLVGYFAIFITHGLYYGYSRITFILLFVYPLLLMSKSLYKTEIS